MTLRKNFLNEGELGRGLDARRAKDKPKCFRTWSKVCLIFIKG